MAKMNIDSLLSEFGQSVLQAQNQINAAALEQSAGLNNLQTGLAVSEIEVDLKMMIDEDDDGVVNIQPISGDLDKLGSLNAGALSSIRARFLTIPDEEVRPPARKPSEVKEEVLAKADVSRLKDIFGDLDVDVSYVAAKNRWLVDVKDPTNKTTLRSLQLDDRPIDIPER
ncbi:hypothetical protein Lepto7376_4583 [[Leptolyngbya] sp. PCC 7376]|uniref:hypothetical protein n=1 Tax=[Leptolyngbya] sp. PCC 7376 TaxID=111781 RepID=UPI00029F158D|nr:hypothetical protein [[Leptolyngbya] sp. PCC 7376]AFY40674.1 hypothetical protein Lepto7376_4583 [[Leptolyngbya] sp. PCC 7376]